MTPCELWCKKYLLIISFHSSEEIWQDGVIPLDTKLSVPVEKMADVFTSLTDGIFHSQHKIYAPNQHWLWKEKRRTMGNWCSSLYMRHEYYCTESFFFEGVWGLWQNSNILYACCSLTSSISFKSQTIRFIVWSTALQLFCVCPYLTAGAHHDIKMQIAVFFTWQLDWVLTFCQLVHFTTSWQVNVSQ